MVPKASSSQEGERPAKALKVEDEALLDAEEIPDDLLDEINAEAFQMKGDVEKQRGGFDETKDFNGQMYRGMAVGGSHTWNYDQGVWKETKVRDQFQRGF